MYSFCQRDYKECVFFSGYSPLTTKRKKLGNDSQKKELILKDNVNKLELLLTPTYKSLFGSWILQGLCNLLPL